MNWLDIRRIEKKIIQLRNLRMVEENIENQEKIIQDKLFESILPILLKEMKKYRNKGMKLYQEEKNLMKLVTSLLKIEAEVMSLINIAIYVSFEENISPYYYIEKNKIFVLEDYLNMVSYYATDFEEIFFLANFYQDKCSLREG
ncbi:hypothetical protein [Enterococcus lactis]|uniref:hypothetical protein n=1 Tax=Enterococcus lactis TaxID=357441 RepID=UPI00404106E8